MLKNFFCEYVFIGLCFWFALLKYVKYEDMDKHVTRKDISGTSLCLCLLTSL